MFLYSTNNPHLHTPFKEAVFNSLPKDNGLYLPHIVPKLDPEFIHNLDKYELPEIAFMVANALLAGAIPEDDLKAIVDDAINFPAPVNELGDGTYVLELFHGPSLAFKDFGARFMSRVMGYFLEKDEQMLDVLVATSGDTGGAVALGFLGVAGTRVTILYPKGMVSPVQEMQLTTNSENIRAIEVNGTFDDCQALVKQAFNDPDLRKSLRLTSANSINISRLIPQTFYYFNTYAALLRKGKKEVIFAVPSGNFGNLAAGLLAWKMGLPVKHFLAATNANDTVPAFLETGIYQAKSSVQTWSNAMDVGNPSNWVRILELFEQNVDNLKTMVSGYRFTDKETVAAIQKMHLNNRYIVCPHTAISWLGATKWREQHPQETAAMVFLSTAHPCKFPEVFPPGIREDIEIPEMLKAMVGKPRSVTSMENDFEALKNLLFH